MFVVNSILSYKLVILLFDEPILLGTALLLILIWGLRRFFQMPSQKVFLIDFACSKPPLTQMTTKIKSIQRLKIIGNHSEEMMDYMKMTIEKVGLGDKTYFPEALHKDPPNPCLAAARQEAEIVMFGSLDNLFDKTKVQPKDIGILIVNCSIFHPVPSLSSMIVNRYKLNHSTLCYNLTGMGCTAGLVAVRLANQLLQVHKNKCALILSTENTTDCIYVGNDESKVIPNCTFRVGGAAILLSNRPLDKINSKYELLHDVHTHAARLDRSYKSIFLEEDGQGFIGVSITKDLLVAATNAIETNVTLLGPLILPLSEKYLFLKNIFQRRVLGVAKVKKYVPKFNTSVDHFFPHVGGLPVLNQLQKLLNFSDESMEASKITLRRFGNTSSSSVWYELAYAEAKGRIKKNDRIWQLAFGSGFKCSSLIWRAVRSVDTNDSKNPWNGEIDTVELNLNGAETFYEYFERPN